MTCDASTMILLKAAEAGNWAAPVMLGRPAAPGRVQPGVRTRSLAWPPGLAPCAAAGVTLAVLAVVAARHAGQRRFQIGSDLGSGTGLYRVGVDLGSDPAVRTVIADAVAVVAAAEGRRSDRDTGRQTHEPVLVRHRYSCDGLQLPADPGVLDVVFHWASGELVANARYDERSFDGSSVEVLLDHLACALQAVGDDSAGNDSVGDDSVGDDSVAVSGLSLADERERRTLAEWGGSATVARPAESIPAMVRQHASRAPADVALTGPSGPELSYSDLVARVERVSAALSELGVGPETVVVLYAERSVELVVTLLGVLDAGGAYIGLDPLHTPDDRLTEIVTAADARLVVTDRELCPCPVPTVDMAVLGQRPHSTSPSWQSISVDNTAYVSYTSGSTGVPKGVAVSHRAVARLVQDPAWEHLGPEGATLFLSPVAFDASTLEIWGPLCNGGRVAVYPPGQIRLDELADFVRHKGVTAAWFTAGLFHRLVDADLSAFAGLRHVIAGGDVVSGEHVRRLLEAHPHLRFTNGYGPTENTTFTTCWTTESAYAGGSTPIGRPIPGTKVVILDDDLRPVPMGVPGQLYAGGVGLAKGYLHQPALTADRFVPDPDGSAPGERLYRTGDIARWRPDGQLEFCGRADTQVKIRGYRVETTEVEAALERRPEVAEAVVVAEPDPLAGHRLAGYVRLDGPQRDTAESQALAAQIRQHLGDQLPAYMVPPVIVPMVEFPVNGNGKIDRARLAAGMRSPRILGERYIAPRTDTEARLAAIWAGVLRVDPIGVQDDFFDLGGHSLAVSQLIQEVEMEFDTIVKARTVFLRPTVASLAEVLQNSFAGVNPHDGGSVR